MADVKWIKLATGLPDNRKIKQIRHLPNGDTIVLMWIFLMCLAGETNDEGMVYFMPEIPYTEEMLADQFSIDVNTVRLGLATFQRFGMIEIIDDIICLPTWEKWQAVDKLSEIREQTRKRVAKHREKQKLCAGNVTGNVTVTQSNATELDIEPDIEPEEEIINNVHDSGESARSVSKPNKADIEAFFDSIWQLYPVKKGKGQVSNTKRKALYNIGYEEIERAIGRYLQELKRDSDWRKAQNGSTFFNSGYVDYLDANFVPNEPRKDGVKHGANYSSASSIAEGVGTWL